MAVLKLLFFLFVLCFSPVLAFAEEKTLSVDYGKLYQITYEAKDMTVFDVIANSQDTGLIFEIDVTSPAATLKLIIPRVLLDSKDNGEDSNFFIIADGTLVTFSEKEKTEVSRTLLIQLTPEITELEVFGTQLGSNPIINEPAEGNLTTEPVKEIPKENPEKPPMEEKVPVETAPEKQPSNETVPEEEKPKDNLEKPSMEKTPYGFDLSKLSNWSISINERQMQEFMMAGGTFIAFAILLMIIKGSRTARSLP